MSPSPTLSLADRAPALREASRRARATISLRHVPGALWPYVSNSDMLNQRSGYGPLALALEPREAGAPLVLASGTYKDLAYGFVERPHTFVAPRMLDVDRPFTHGPITYFGFSMTLEPRPEGGTELSLEVRWVDTSEAAPCEGLMQERLRLYAAEIHRIDAALAGEAAGQPFAAFLDDPRAHAEAIALLAARFTRLTRSEQAARALAEFVVLAPDAYVQRIRPFEIAAHWGAPPIEVLELCLRAVRDGIFDMRWDVLCTSCRESMPGPSHLVELTAAGHCGFCGIDFGASFDENVEVKFFPVPKVRAFESVFFCAGPPAQKPHVVAQVVVEANATRSFVLDLPPGEYEMRDELVGLEKARRLRIGPGGAPKRALVLGDKPAEDERLVLAEGAEIVVSNPRATFETLRFEKLARHEGAATAALVTSLQVFRDLFSSEVLRPGVQLGVSNLTVLFSDLKDSTVLYERRGDAPAFALVQDHFEIMTEVIRKNAGGVVKTIGDAVMAVFQSADAAMRAALEILSAFRQWNATHATEQRIVIKLGMHRGPCLALNQNDKLDYFGQTVNKAARIQGQSVGDDLVLSRELFQDPEVAQALALGGAYDAAPFVAELKGIAGHTELVRVTRR